MNTYKCEFPVNGAKANLVQSSVLRTEVPEETSHASGLLKHPHIILSREDIEAHELWVAHSATRNAAGLIMKMPLDWNPRGKLHFRSAPRNMSSRSVQYSRIAKYDRQPGGIRASAWTVFCRSRL